MSAISGVGKGNLSNDPNHPRSCNFSLHLFDLSFGGRPVESWTVDIDYGAIGDARFWIDKETHAVLKVATRGPDIQGVLYKILLPDE